MESLTAYKKGVFDVCTNTLKSLNTEKWLLQYLIDNLQESSDYFSGYLVATKTSLKSISDIIKEVEAMRDENKESE